jgi:hypothetical protein
MQERTLMISSAVRTWPCTIRKKINSLFDGLEKSPSIPHSGRVDLGWGSPPPPNKKARRDFLRGYPI